MRFPVLVGPLRRFSVVMADLAAGKKAAAIKAIDDFVKVPKQVYLNFLPILCPPPSNQDNQKLGVGSGSTIVFAVERLGMDMHTLLALCVWFPWKWL
jgi:hypothetical protein